MKRKNITHFYVMMKNRKEKQPSQIKTTNIQKQYDEKQYFKNSSVLSIKKSKHSYFSHCQLFLFYTDSFGFITIFGF